MVLTSLTKANARGGPIQYSSRSRYARFYWWLNDDLDPVADMPAGGWPILVAGHPGNGSNQGDFEWNNDILEDFANNRGIVVSYDYCSAAFYEPTGMDPRGLVFPETLFEHVEIWAFLARNYAESSIWGNGVELTRESTKKVMFGFSHTGWVAGLLNYIPNIEMPSGFKPYGHSRYHMSADDWRFDRCIVTQGHMCMRTFWAHPSSILTLSGWTTATSYSTGATVVSLTGGVGTWVQGSRVVFASDSSYEYLVTSVSGSDLTVWPALRHNVPSGDSIGLTTVSSFVAKYGDFGWAGAVALDSYAAIKWNDLSDSFKRQLHVPTYLVADNQRVYDSQLMLMYPAANDPFITNDSDATTGWAATMLTAGPNQRHASLHCEGNAYAVGGLLTQLGLVQGTDFFMRAGGSRTNSNASTRYGGSSTTDLLAFLDV